MSLHVIKGTEPNCGGGGLTETDLASPVQAAGLLAFHLDVITLVLK